MANNYTTTTIITGALAKIGLGRAENLDQQNDIQNNLPFLNFILDSLDVDGLLVQQTLDEGFLLTGGIRQYLIGSSLTPSPSAFVTSRPWRIESAYIVDQPGNHYTVELISRDQFNTIVDQQFSMSRPTQLFYDIGPVQQSNEIGTIWLYYIPDFYDSYTLHIVSVKQLQEFATVNDVVTFDNSYMNLLQVELAILLAPNYGKVVSPDLYKQERMFKDIVYAQNYRRPTFPRKRGGGFSMNIYTSQVNN